jgi:predicted DNA-binding transcriptional regulator AlpA
MRKSMEDRGERAADPLPERLLGRRDLSRLFGVTPETITSWARRGDLPQAVVIGRKAFWQPSAIRSLLGRAG